MTFHPVYAGRWELGNGVGLFFFFFGFDMLSFPIASAWDLEDCSVL